MIAFAVISFFGAIFLQAQFGGSSFLPKTDGKTLAIDVRSPASSNLEYSRIKLEAAAIMARSMPETKATNSYVNPTGGRIYVDIGKSTERKRTAQEIAIDLRKRTSQLVGAEYTVLDDLSNGAAKPVQIRFSGTDSRKLLAITSEFMEKLRQVPGAVDVGLSQQDPQNELQIELSLQTTVQKASAITDEDILERVLAAAHAAFQTPAADGTDAAAIGQDEHARTGAPVRRALDVDDGRQDRAVSGASRSGPCGKNAIQLVHGILQSRAAYRPPMVAPGNRGKLRTRVVSKRE